MWICIDCEFEFEFEFENTGCIGDLVERTCPFCGSATIVDCLDFYQPEMDDAIDDAIDSFDCSEQDYIDAGLEMPEYIEEQIADMHATMKDLIPEIPEHPKCSCMGSNIPEHLAYGQMAERIPQLSFGDMEINEKLLIGLPVTDAILSMQYDKYDAYESCIVEMNERFLHTFIDDRFVP